MRGCSTIWRVVISAVAVASAATGLGQEITSVALRGTIDIVVATRDGVVMASDSRVSRDDGSYSDDAQKLFAVGKNGACLIAGLAGADFGVQNFHLTDTLGSHIVALGRSLGDRDVAAGEIARAVGDGLSSVSGLLVPMRIRPTLVGEASIVSVNSQGGFDWVTFVVPIVTHYDARPERFDLSTPIYIVHSTTFGLRFDAQALGQPQVAEALLRANSSRKKICGTQPGQPPWCVSNAFTNSAIMREYYLRKRLGTLDGFTLKGGIGLAETLIRATIETADPSWGVGGPIDVLTVTKAGTKWVHRKPAQSFAPPFSRTLEGMGFKNGLQPIDGLQCLACTFENMQIFYSGTAQVELVQPTFKGKCQLMLDPDARTKRPDDVAYLEKVVAGHCEIVER